MLSFFSPTLEISYLEGKAMDASAHMQETLKELDLNPMKWSELNQEEKDQVLQHCRTEAIVAGHMIK